MVGVLLALIACQAHRTPVVDVPPPSPPLSVPSLPPPSSLRWRPATAPKDEAPMDCGPDVDTVVEARALAEREYARATSSTSTVVAAHVFEAIPSLFVRSIHHVSPPTFAPDFIDLIGRWPTSGTKVVFSRELLGRVRALARVDDTTGAKADALLELAELDELSRRIAHLSVQKILGEDRKPLRHKDVHPSKADRDREGNSRSEKFLVRADDPGITVVPAHVHTHSRTEVQVRASRYQ